MDNTYPSRSFIAEYVKHKIFHLYEFLLRVFTAFFRHRALIGRIKLNEFESFKHAIDDVAIAISVLALQDQIAAAIVGANLNSSIIHETLDEIKIISLLVLLPAAFLFLLRAVTSDDHGKYHSLTQCYAYLVSSVVFAFSMFKLAVMVATRACYGQAATWKDFAAEGCKDALEFECASPSALGNSAENFRKLVTQWEWTACNIADGFIYASFAALLAMSFVCHLRVFKTMLGISYKYIILFYALYIPAVILYMQNKITVTVNVFPLTG